MLSIWRGRPTSVCVVIAGAFVFSGCFRESPDDVAKRLDGAYAANRAANRQAGEVSVHRCRVGDGNWDFICEQHFEPGTVDRARVPRPMAIDTTWGVKTTATL
jgi:hypothetical protein